MVDDPAVELAQMLTQAAAAGEQIVMTGGSTPRRAYELAAKRRRDWRATTLWWGDERCVPPDDERSNYGLAKRTLLDHLDVQPRAVHRARGEVDAEDAAREYDAALDGIRLQLNFLGIGPDGHTASLFPNAPGLTNHEQRAITAEPGLDPKVMRITMTPPMLRNADTVLFLVIGEEKAEAVARAFGGPPNKGTPSSMIRSDGGRTIAVLDREAAALLEHA